MIPTAGKGVLEVLCLMSAVCVNSATYLFIRRELCIGPQNLHWLLWVEMLM
jgi:hypothetical protein